MNRLELAALAPPVPDWYREERKTDEILKVKLTEITNNNKNVTYWDNSIKSWKKELHECIKRNQKIQEQDIRTAIYQNEQQKEKEFKIQYGLEFNKQIEFDWRFYWADEMIKRNETN